MEICLSGSARRYLKVPDGGSNLNPTPLEPRPSPKGLWRPDAGDPPLFFKVKNFQDLFFYVCHLGVQKHLEESCGPSKASV